ncbi:hypothetical protein NDU88_010510 [Pleurodeles waltl]|uniref:Uncharacterized protein n=1 Tax=Pleurodeles waltl TaxID=8319 RepID=A0AAV7S1K7_PLEWA|nr:hypothetical protein NDU88_010510 [Pleurodeles waltl]
MARFGGVLTPHHNNAYSYGLQQQRFVGRPGISRLGRREPRVTGPGDQRKHGGHFGAAESSHETETSNRPQWLPDISSRMLLETGHVSTDLEAQSSTAKVTQRPDRA